MTSPSIRMSMPRCLSGTLQIAVVTLVVLLSVSRSAAQADPVAHANIPFQFWIDDQQLPSGTYTISSVTSTLLVFYNEKANAAEHTFTVPVDRNLPATESDLLFLLKDGKYILAEVRENGHEQRLTGMYDIDLPANSRRTQVPITFTAK